MDSEPSELPTTMPDPTSREWLKQRKQFQLREYLQHHQARQTELLLA